LTMQPSLLKQFNTIALLAALLTLITYFATTLAELKFLITEKHSIFRLVKTKALWVSLMASLYAVWMITNFQANLILTTCGLFIISIPLYFLTIKSK